MQQLGLVNSYGLFRVMTTERPEIIIEGSDDGQNWKPYEFVWKPGDPLREPSFTTPHMPRLDWQMWFAALSIYYDHQIPPWLELFAQRLKAGDPAVLALLDYNPVPAIARRSNCACRSISTRSPRPRSTKKPARGGRVRWSAARSSTGRTASQRCSRPKSAR